MGIPDHLTCLLRNLYAGQEATLRIVHGTTDWFQIGKRVSQGCILSPCLFNLYAEYIMRNAGWKKHKLESRFPGEISITSDMQMTPPLWKKVKRNSKASRSEEHTSELQSPLNIVCRLLLEKKKQKTNTINTIDKNGPQSGTIVEPAPR